MRQQRQQQRRHSRCHPVLKNLILVGNGGSKQGIRLRCRHGSGIDNAKICGKGQPLTVETALTENALKNGTSKLTNITLTAELSSKEGIYTMPTSSP
mgnify:CR=1 FL=1